MEPEQSKDMGSGISLAPLFALALLSWYDANRRDLPWRKAQEPACGEPVGSTEAYAVLVSEVMLQQTTVQAVIPHFEKWMVAYPTMAELAAADQEEVLRQWEGLGYYSRARNLLAAAREIVEKYSGRVPDDPKYLRRLPGIGEYTAAAVASIAYGVPAPALDANNVRVWSRLLASSDRKRVARVFARTIPHDRPGDFNQALMDLGSSICTAINPDCPACPLTTWCRAFRTDLVSEFPAKKVQPDTVRIEAAIGIVLREGKVLVQKRPEKGLMAGLWEFPGGKIKKIGKWNVEGEKDNLVELPEEAVVREVREETELSVQIDEKLGVFTHSYTRFRVKLHVFICRRKAGKLGNPAAKWVTLKEMEGLAMPSVNRRIVKKLEERLNTISSD